MEQSVLLLNCVWYRNNVLYYLYFFQNKKRLHLKNKWLGNVPPQTVTITTLWLFSFFFLLPSSLPLPFPFFFLRSICSSGQGGCISTLFLLATGCQSQWFEVEFWSCHHHYSWFHWVYGTHGILNTILNLIGTFCFHRLSASHLTLTTNTWGDRRNHSHFSEGQGLKEV